MISLGGRIEELRSERGLSRPALCAELNFPKNAIEKFETGRQTPTKAQQERMAEYFGVSLLYLRGETNDRTRMSTWMEEVPDEPADELPAAVKKAAKKPKEPKPEGGILDGPARYRTGKKPAAGDRAGDPAFPRGAGRHPQGAQMTLNGP